MDDNHFNFLADVCVFVLLCWFKKGFLHDFGIIHRDVKVRVGGDSQSWVQDDS